MSLLYLEELRCDDLYVCCMNDDYDGLKKLLDKKPPIHHINMIKYLAIAHFCSFTRILELLSLYICQENLDHRFYNFKCIFTHICKYGSRDTIDTILNKKIPVDIEEEFYAALFNNRYELATYLFSKGNFVIDWNWLLLKAANFNNHKIAENAIINGANNYQVALKISCEKNHIKTLDTIAKQIYGKHIDILRNILENTLIRKQFKNAKVLIQYMPPSYVKSLSSIAIQQNDIGMIKVIVETNPRVLTSAFSIYCQNKDIARYLRSKKIKVHGDS